MRLTAETPLGRPTTEVLGRLEAPANASVPSFTTRLRKAALVAGFIRLPEPLIRRLPAPNLVKSAAWMLAVMTLLPVWPPRTKTKASVRAAAPVPKRKVNGVTPPMTGGVAVPLRIKPPLLICRTSVASVPLILESVRRERTLNVSVTVAVPMDATAEILARTVAKGSVASDATRVLVLSCRLPVAAPA